MAEKDLKQKIEGLIGEYYFNERLVPVMKDTLEVLCDMFAGAKNTGQVDSDDGFCESALRIFPGVSTVRLYAGFLYKLDGKEEKAEITLKDVLPTKENSEISCALGLKCLNKGKAMASEWFKRSLEYDPGNRHSRIYLDFYRNRYDGSFEVDISSLESGDALVFLNIGSVCLKQKEYNNAIKYLMIAEKLEPESKEPKYFLGVAYSGMNDAKALEKFLEATKIDPVYAAALRDLAAEYEKREMDKEAKEYYQRLVKTDEVTPIDNIKLAQLAAKAGDIDEALEQYGFLINPPKHGPFNCVSANYALMNPLIRDYVKELAEHNIGVLNKAKQRRGKGEQDGDISIQMVDEERVNNPSRYVDRIFKDMAEVFSNPAVFGKVKNQEKQAVFHMRIGGEIKFKRRQTKWQKKKKDQNWQIC